MVLKELLKKNRSFNCYYNGGLSNHIPMVLIALKKMGASDEKLTEYFDGYYKKLEPIKPTEIKITNSNWRQFLGKFEFLSDYYRFFLNKIHNYGIDLTLKAFLRHLIPGVSGGAFHPLIHLGYAVSIHDEDETAFALAEFALSYTPLGRLLDNESDSDPISVFSDIAHSDNFKNIKKSDGLIWKDMIKASITSCFDEASSSLKIGEDTLRHVALLLISLYEDTRDFTVLHGVTSIHAFRILSPYFKDEKLALRYMFKALCAAYITAGSPLPTEKSTINEVTMDWEEIFKRAISSSDAHTIKFVYTCFEEYSFCKEPIYKKAAYNKVM